MRRMFWLTVGVGVGTAGTIYVLRWARRQRDRFAPTRVVQQATEVARDLGQLLTEALEEFRKGMAEREAELRAGLPG